MSFILAVLGVFFVLKIISIIATLRHKKRNLGKKGLAQVIAHRGSRQEGLPENTIAAFTDSVKAGADVVELDVWITTDGKVVVHHDDTLTRMSGGKCNSKIYEMAYGDLPAIIPYAEQNERISKFTEAETTRIPLFKEVLDKVPSSTTINIEFKQDSDLLISEVGRILTEKQRKDTVFWFSLDEKINKKLRIADPSIPTIASILGMLKVLMLYYFGILPFVSLDDAVFGVTVEEITLDKIRHEKALKGAPDWVKRILAFLFQGRPPVPMVAPGLFLQLRSRGVPVWFLGINTEEDLMIAINSGATAVLTDRVNWLVQLMKEKELKFQQIEA